MQLQHNRPRVGSRWRDQELRLTADVPSRGEHPPGSTKCHPPVQSTNLRFPGQELKGTVAHVKAEKAILFWAT